METTTMMIMEFTFIGWWGWLMLAPLCKEPVKKVDEDDYAAWKPELDKVRRAQGIDVDACNASWEKYCKENGHENG